ncbi:hypothetical protein AYI68_g2046 [Smittium mucronatum]|uniref:FAS1 domain-containing protein n=1 Tax=Smittium mucronatum TaxID=133383 RepID=A0A1R0H3P1_9FUNG|nr:hypothetical protein AYI68_g2046 [Smittium mucronatum]
MFEAESIDPDIGPYTLFAPTDQAIRKSGLEKLPENEIFSIITYHVLGKKVLSKDITNDIKFYPTLQQETKYFNLPGGKPQVLGLVRSGSKVNFKDGAFDPAEGPVTVAQADFQAAKSVLHIVDKILQIPRKSTHNLGGQSKICDFGERA